MSVEVWWWDSRGLGVRVWEMGVGMGMGKGTKGVVTKVWLWL